jgi:Mg2+ and Co2+ transporter CorA
MRIPTNSAAEMIDQMTKDNTSIEENIVISQQRHEEYIQDCRTRIAKNIETIAILESVAQWTE